MDDLEAYELLREDEKHFLNSVAQDIAMIVSNSDEYISASKKLRHFQKKLKEFSQKNDEYNIAYKAYSEGRWIPSMGKPNNMLGTIWPAAYRFNWDESINPKFTVKPHNIFAYYVPPDMGLLGDYALLGVIHDKLLPHCSPIAKGILSDEIIQIIWHNLITGIDIEGSTIVLGQVAYTKPATIRKSIIEGCRDNIRKDIVKLSPKKAAEIMSGLENVGATQTKIRDNASSKKIPKHSQRNDVGQKILNATNPEELLEAIEPLLDQAEPSPAPGESSYLDKLRYMARQRAIRLRGNNPKLSQVPATNEISEILQWCINNKTTTNGVKTRDKTIKQGNDGQAAMANVDKVFNEEKQISETDIITTNNDRKIELINDFCNWADKLIDYINHPDESREVSTAKVDIFGDSVNNLAQKIWPQINFDEKGWPYQSPNNWGYISQYSEGIFAVPPEQKEQIIKCLQYWKERALKDKSNLQKLLIQQRKQETIQVGLREELVKNETNVPDYKATNPLKVPVSKLIKYRESNTLEFKETLEYDVKKNQVNKNLNKECLKTIAAFLNTIGGTLLIGVKDDGTIAGIKNDLQHVQRKNLDGFELKLRNLIKNRFDPAPLGKVDIKFPEIEDVIICRINVSPVNRSQTVHLDNEVYIRDGNTTIKLEGRRLTDWIQQRSQSDNIVL